MDHQEAAELILAASVGAYWDPASSTVAVELVRCLPTADLSVLLCIITDTCRTIHDANCC